MVSRLLSAAVSSVDEDLLPKRLYATLRTALLLLAVYKLSFSRSSLVQCMGGATILKVGVYVREYGAIFDPPPTFGLLGAWYSVYSALEALATTMRYKFTFCIKLHYSPAYTGLYTVHGECCSSEELARPSYSSGSWTR